MTFRDKQDPFCLTTPVNKIYTFFVKAEDPDYKAFSDFVRPATYEWDKPKIDSVMMHHVKEYARGRGKNG